MSPMFGKLVTGLKANPLNTLIKGTRYLFRLAGSLFANILYLFLHVQTYVVPTRSLAKLKLALNPIVRLDYPRHPIFLHADSELSLSRANACQKEPETIAWIEELFKPGEVFYDVGANVGAYSLVASKYLHGDVIIHSFEPSFSTYYELCKNIVLNKCDQNIYPHMIGLSSVSGSMVFNYHSLEIGDSLHILGEDLTVGDAPLRPVFRQNIMAFTVDDLILRFDYPIPNHIKLDVDGTELEILKGAERTLQDPRVRSLLVEVHLLNGQAEKAESFLSKLGFKHVSETARGGPYWNYIFSR